MLDPSAGKKGASDSNGATRKVACRYHRPFDDRCFTSLRAFDLARTWGKGEVEWHHPRTVAKLEGVEGVCRLGEPGVARDATIYRDRKAVERTRDAFGG